MSAAFEPRGEIGRRDLELRHEPTHALRGSSVEKYVRLSAASAPTTA